MAKRRYRKKSSSNGMGKASSLVKRAGMGLLGAMVVGAVAKKFVPQYADIASYAGAYLGGGFVGLATNFVVSGAPSIGGSSNGVRTI